jgi:hypothetical protein
MIPIHHGYEIDHSQPKEIRAWSLVNRGLLVDHGHKVENPGLADHGGTHMQPWFNHGNQW